MNKIVKTQNAPEPIGPYNQAVWAGNMLYISGQIPISPGNGEMKNQNIETETVQIMENLKAVLNAASLTFKHVVKTSIYITDMQDFSRINAVYAQYFDEENAPARETVQVSALPKGARVEISAIASK